MPASVLCPGYNPAFLTLIGSRSIWEALKTKQNDVEASLPETLIEVKGM